MRLKCSHYDRLGVLDEKTEVKEEERKKRAFANFTRSPAAFLAGKASSTPKDIGGECGNRTHDFLHAKQTLCP